MHAQAGDQKQAIAKRKHSDKNVFRGKRTYCGSASASLATSCRISAKHIDFAVKLRTQTKTTKWEKKNHHKSGRRNASEESPLTRWRESAICPRHIYNNMSMGNSSSSSRSSSSNLFSWTTSHKLGSCFIKYIHHNS